MKAHHESLLRTLHECALACEHCYSGSLREKDSHHLANCIRLTAECAQFCRLAEFLLATESDFTAELIDVCSDVCAGCARECEQHKHEHCKACAAACRNCEEACENFAPSSS